MPRRPRPRLAVLTSVALALAALISGCRTAPPAITYPANAAQATEDAALRRELEAVNAAMAAAFNRGDYVGAARFYTDDAQIIGGGPRVAGRAAIDRYWTSIPAGANWRLDVIEVGGGRTSPWQLGRSTLVMPSRSGDGTTSTSIVDFLGVWRRQPDGSLKLYLDMYVPAPRPAAPR